MTTLEDGTAVADDSEVGPPAASPDVPVAAHQSAPGRTVFVEEQNSDSWIASSLTVDLRR
ncbi:MAG: hypothetical protein BRD23_06820 [Halobacteriales archaeon SW_9_67_25]|jgi:hypothetical protein|nr:MAG: hypothetical protein BRD23_06820 [Halobacteriales archaeon SW_9_67_25]